MTTTTVLTKLTHIECGDCGVAFALTEGFIKARKEDHKTWYCPNGHSRWFPAENEEEKARRQLATAERRLASTQTSLIHTRDQLEATERSRAAIKGQVTKIKKRIVAGTCPVGCRRHFADLQAHIETKHPGYTTVGEPDA